MMVKVRKNIKKFPLIFVLVFLAAFLIRCGLINWTLQYGNNTDLVRYEDWAKIAHVKNFAATYTTSTRHSATFWSPANNQPPGTIYILSGAYELWITTGKIIARVTHTVPGSITAVNTYLQHIFMKFPPLLTDLGMGLLAYLLVVKEMGRKKGLLAASLILFNPVILYNSAVWGQMDSLNNFFFLLSLFLAFRKNIKLSMLAFAASLYVKLSLLPLLPFYLIFLFFISKKDLEKIVIGIILTVGAVIIATFPVSANPVVWLLTKMPVIAQGELQNVTVAAFNFWWIIFCSPTVGHANIPPVTQIFFGLPLRSWAYDIFGILCLPFLYLQIKRPQQFISKHNVFLVFSLIALLLFLFLPGMHDRYMYPVFPLLAIAVALSKRARIYMIIFCLLSLFSLINVIYSWYPIVLDSTSAFYHFFYGDTFGWIISILTVVVAGWFYLKSFTDLRKAK
jgi:Gpi18-like mannosyltransferase